MKDIRKNSTGTFITTGGFKGPIRPWPPIYVPYFSKKNSNGLREHFTIIFSVSKFNLPLHRTNFKSHYSYGFNRFIHEKLSFIATLLRAAICYISFSLASRFNTEICKKNCSSSGDPRSTAGALPRDSTGDFCPQAPRLGPPNFRSWVRQCFFTIFGLVMTLTFDPENLIISSLSPSVDN